ncbi:MAG: flagellar basal-body rod protein FlgF [Myxococcota bacterium]|jgi:flagellar basal-body rod protein FlgF
MGNGIYKAVSATRAQLRRLDVLANNIANASTPGFKEDAVRFEEVMDQRAQGVQDFVQSVESVTRMTQGTLRATGNPLDVAISGEGFFVVETPDGEKLTRAGHLVIGAERVLHTDSGHKIMGEAGPIVVPPAPPGVTAPLSIDGQGEIKLGDLVVGTLRRVTVPDNNVRKLGNNLFSTEVEPRRLDSATGGQVMQGHIELSNVNPLGAMTKMIQVQRTFDSLQQAIKAYREVDQQSVRRMR